LERQDKSFPGRRTDTSYEAIVSKAAKEKGKGRKNTAVEVGRSLQTGYKSQTEPETEGDAALSGECQNQRNGK